MAKMGRTDGMLVNESLRSSFGICGFMEQSSIEIQAVSAIVIQHD